MSCREQKNPKCISYTYILYYILYLIIFQSFFKHVAAQQVVAAAKPVFQTLAILEKTTTSERLVLNIKLLGMRLTKFLELGGRLGTIHILRKHLYLIFHKKQGFFLSKRNNFLLNTKVGD